MSPEPIENEPQQSDPHIDQENNVTEPNHNEEHHEGNKDSDNEGNVGGIEILVTQIDWQAQMILLTT